MKRCIVFCASIALGGCSTAVKHSCPTPNGPECASVQQAYTQSLVDIDGARPSKELDKGYYPTSQPTETLDVVREIKESKKKKKTIVDKVLAYLHGTKPVPLPAGVGPNGVPLAPGNMNDDYLYFSVTPDPTPKGYVPPQFIRVWVPEWVTRTGELEHASYFDMLLEQGHWAVGVKEADLRYASAKHRQSKGNVKDDGYVKYVAKYQWGYRIWERDAMGNVTITNRFNNGRRTVEHYPAGSSYVPFPLGKRVYPPIKANQKRQTHVQTTPPAPAQGQASAQAATQVPATTYDAAGNAPGVTVGNMR